MPAKPKKFLWGPDDETPIATYDPTWTTIPIELRPYREGSGFHRLSLALAKRLRVDVELSTVSQYIPF